ncbi:uncharacterized protein LOC113229227, partial [Hyposmocoma kahamanoa]|uniref:uncharacterized protein LOC113229227 n=1 Tax=Hyposmocoma kahamanoa TaxID=1477025 RepID=UPI000E6D68EA
KKDSKDERRPVYRAESRVHIEPVKPLSPIVKHDMLADQPAPAGTTEINRVDTLTIPNYGFVAAPAEVAYPDVPYAPGYGYDSGYGTSNNYDVYANGPNSYLMEPDTSAFSLLWSQVPDSRTMVSYVGRTFVWMFNSIFTLLIGSLLTVGVCSYTNLCSITFHGVGPIHEEMRSLMSPERLEKISHAADFVKTAINKYQKIQKVTDRNGQRKRRAAFYRKY